MEKIDVKDLVKGHVYKLRCRNLRYGVYDGALGFVGIRKKWEARYLFTEFHWDRGEPYGTVRGMEDTGVSLPEGVDSSARDFGSVDKNSGRDVDYLEMGDGNFVWVYTDTGQADPNIQAVRKGNMPLKEFMETFEASND